MRFSNRMLQLTLALAAVVLTIAAARADWPMWGRTQARNMVDPDAKNIPDTFTPGELDSNEHVDMSTTKNVKWAAKLGSQSYGNVTVAGGRVFVGTNNDIEQDDRFQGDFSILACFDEKDGHLLWKLTVPKNGSGKVGDWEYLGICSSPSIDGDRVYVVTNRCEVVCLDVNGMANGNDGDFKDEAQYFAGPGNPKVEVKSTDADIIWHYEMGTELGVFPHNITSSAPLIVGDKVWVETSNGVDWSHTNIPNPLAPAFVCLDKNTGKLAGEEDEHVSERIMHGGWSSPSYGEVNGVKMVFYGGPDGRLYAFMENQFSKDADGFVLFKTAWKYDGNPVNYRFKNGDPKKPIKYARPDGPSEFIATPVFNDGKIYIAIGQDPEHGEGIGNLSCVDAATGKPIWQFDQINRAISTCAVADGRVYLGDYSGYLYCLDANTGELYWKHDTQSHIWGSPLVADGKLWIGNEDGIVTVVHLDAMNKLADATEGPIYTRIKSKRVEVDGKQVKTHILEVKDKDAKMTEVPEEERSKILNEIEMPGPVLASPIIANGTLYITTATHLYAIAKPAE